MFCLDEARDYRRALHGSFFDESMIGSRQALSPRRNRRALPSVTIVAPKRNTGSRARHAGQATASGVAP